MYNTVKPSDDSFEALHFIEFYRLKELKRVYYKENIEIRLGMTFFVYSEHSEGWYQRVVTEHTDPQDLKYEIFLGYVRLVYSEEDKQQIKHILARDNISYTQFIKRSVGEYNDSLIFNKKRYDDGWATKNKAVTKLRGRP